MVAVAVAAAAVVPANAVPVGSANVSVNKELRAPSLQELNAACKPCATAGSALAQQS